LLVNEAYDGNGNRTEVLYHYFDSRTNGWIGHKRYNFIYDNNGNQIEEVNYHWDSISNNRVANSRKLISIDGNGNTTQELHYRWDSEINNWKYFKKVVYHWSDTIENTIDPVMLSDKDNILIFPSPVSDYFIIEIIDLSGRLLRTIDKINSNSKTIQRRDLLSGIYLLRIHANDIYTRDIIMR
jgi:hypothetical protein